jgi:4-carboxymuconolactone decarboxylase
MGPFTILMYSPEIAARTAHLGAYVRFEQKLPPVESHVAIIAAVREFDCRFEWGAWSQAAARAGVRREAIDLVAHRAPLESFTADEAVIVRYTRELLREHRVSQPVFDRMKAVFGEKGLVELTAMIGYFSMLACTLNAFEVEPEPSWPALP